MKRAIFINRYFHPDHSATSQMLSDLAFALAEESALEIHVITGRQLYDNPTAMLPRSDLIRSVVLHRVWTTSFGRSNLLGRAIDYLTFYISVFFALILLAHRGDSIIAKTDPPMISVVAALCARVKKATLVNWTQDLFPEVAKALNISVVSGVLFKPLIWLRNWSLLQASQNVVIGEQMAHKLSSYAVEDRRILVVHNWAKNIEPVPSAKSKLRQSWGLDDKFVVGYSGNLGRGHDVSTIIDTIKLLSHNAEITFLFIGGGSRLPELQKLTGSVGNLVFKPYQPREELSESLSISDVHLISLLPMLEGYMVPSKFYGIIAAARPAIFIGSPNGEISAILNQHECGVVIAPGDSQSLARQILELAANPAAAGQLGINGRKAFEQYYQLNTVVQKWQQLLA